MIPIRRLGSCPAAGRGVARGRDSLAGAISSGFGSGEPNFGIYVQAAKATVVATRSLGADTSRVVTVGGAGSLLVAPGGRAVDTDGFPDAVKPEALGHGNALECWRTVDDVQWTYISPAGRSHISMEE